jgi:hypothetical protein
MAVGFYFPVFFYKSGKKELEVTMDNPYRIVGPAQENFVGYDDCILDILNGLQAGNSYVLLGGRRAGKTSLLKKLENSLLEAKDQSRKYFPIYMDIQGQDFIKDRLSFFKAMYEVIVKDSEAPSWKEPSSGKGVYSHFLEMMQSAAIYLRDIHGSDWTAILLIDELDNLAPRLENDQLFQNLRNLFMSSEFASRLRLVASGVKEMTRLIEHGSPLNFLEYKYLGVLFEEDAQELMQLGFPDGIPELEKQIFVKTGRHPYLMQAILQKLWFAREKLSEQVLNKVCRDYSKGHQDFQTWLIAFGPLEHKIYQLIGSDDHVSEDFIFDKVEGFDGSYIDNSINFLSCHGVIDDADPDKIFVAGELFQNWYQRSQFSIKKSALVQIEKEIQELKKDLSFGSLDEAEKEKLEKVIHSLLEDVGKEETSEEVSKQNMSSKLAHISENVQKLEENADALYSKGEKWTKRLVTLAKITVPFL